MRSAELVPHVRDLFSVCPEYFWLEPWELQDVLFSLGYTDDLVDEGEIWAAVEIARGVYPQCGGQQREQKEAIQPPQPAWRSTDRAKRGEASEASKRSCQAEVTRSEQSQRRR